MGATPSTRYSLIPKQSKAALDHLRPAAAPKLVLPHTCTREEINRLQVWSDYATSGLNRVKELHQHSLDQLMYTKDTELIGTMDARLRDLTEVITQWVNLNQWVETTMTACNVQRTI